MEPLQVRTAKPADVAEMARIREVGGWAGGAGASTMAKYLAGEHHPQHALAPRVIFVAEQGAGIVGYIAGHRTTRFDCDGELQWLFVLPEQRGSGAADRLLRALAEWFIAQDARRVCVNVEPENARARRFYHRHGAETLHPYWLVWPDISVARRPPSSSTPPESSG
ncbi:MAG TPA: GNAT family N-acetyltransferase [Longimicrobium sp.]|nr:GNAT family N-acetyltransferase [Longimicrobium sp.]